VLSCKGQEILFFSKGSRPAWEANQTSQYKGTGALSTGVKRRACGGNHSPPSIPKLRMCVAESRLLSMPSWFSQGETSPFVFSFHLYVQYSSREDVTRREPDAVMLLAQTFTFCLYLTTHRWYSFWHVSCLLFTLKQNSILGYPVLIWLQFCPAGFGIWMSIILSEEKVFLK